MMHTNQPITMNTLAAANEAYNKSLSKAKKACSYGCMSVVEKNNLCCRHFPPKEKQRYAVVPKAEAEARKIAQHFLKRKFVDLKNDVIDTSNIEKTVYGTVKCGKLYI